MIGLIFLLRRFTAMICLSSCWMVIETLHSVVTKRDLNSIV